MGKKQIPSSSEAIEDFLRWFKEEVAASFYSEEVMRDMVEYVVLELLNNAHEYGNKTDSSKNIAIEWGVQDKNLVVSVKDEGAGFTPNIPNEPPPLGVNRGRGLWSIVKDVHSLEFNEKGNKATVTFIKDGGINDK